MTEQLIADLAVPMAVIAVCLTICVAAVWRLAKAGVRVSLGGHIDVEVGNPK